MEGGQVVNINLESGLDIKSSDMIVPFNQATFQHNWQKYQGKYLPNSLRFEHNGWAAGWNVYDFRYNLYTEVQNGNTLKVEALSPYSFLIGLYEGEEPNDEADSVAERVLIKDSAIVAGGAKLGYSFDAAGEPLKDVVLVDMRADEYEPTQHADLTWDVSGRKFSCDDDRYRIEQSINDGKCVEVAVHDTRREFDVVFNVALASDLCGDSIVTQKYAKMEPVNGLAGHYWGWDGYNDENKGYRLILNKDSGTLCTPEGSEISIENITGNSFEFSYNADINDETIDFNFSNATYYRYFDSLRGGGADGSDKPLIASDADPNQAYNLVRISLDKNALYPDKVGQTETDNSLRLSVDVPIWAFAGVRVKGNNDEPFVYTLGKDVTSDYSVDIKPYLHDLISVNNLVNDQLLAMTQNPGATRMQLLAVVNFWAYVADTVGVTLIKETDDYWYYTGSENWSLDWNGHGTLQAKTWLLGFIQGQQYYRLLVSNFLASQRSFVTIAAFEKMSGAQSLLRDVNISVKTTALPYDFVNNVIDAADTVAEVFLPGLAAARELKQAFDAGGYDRMLEKFNQLANRPGGAAGSTDNYHYATLQEGWLNLVTWFNIAETKVAVALGSVSTNFKYMGSSVELSGNAQAIAEDHDNDKTHALGVAIPFYGKMVSKLSYRRISQVSDITRNDAECTLAFEPVTDEELLNRPEYSNYIFVDRDGYAGNGCTSMKLFSLNKAGIIPDRGDNSGTMQLKLTPETNNVQLLYSSKNVSAITVNDTGALTRTVTEGVYFPDFVFGDYTNRDESLLNVVSTPMQFAINWRPVASSLPTAVAAIFSNKNTKGSAHILFKERSPLSELNIELGDISDDYTSRVFSISTLEKGSKKLTLVYDDTQPKDKVRPISGINDFNFIADGRYPAEVKASGIVNSYDADNKISVKIGLAISLKFDKLAAKFYKVSPGPDDGYTMTGAGNDYVELSVVKNSIKNDLKYAVNQRQFMKGSFSSLDIQDTANESGEITEQFVKGKFVYFKSFTAAMRGVYDDGAFEKLDSKLVVSFEYDDDTYALNLGNIKPENSDVYIDSVDIREPNNVRQIGRLQTQGQYQLLKQQWNSTSDVENFWWVNNDHILELNDHAFVLKRNTGKLHDWDGEIFENVYEVPRAEIYTCDVQKVLVTNVCGTFDAKLIAIYKSADGVDVHVHNIRNKLQLEYSFRLAPRHVDLGERLNNGVLFSSGAVPLNTYNWLTPEALLAKAEWTATVTQSLLVFGCHVSKNFDQWAIVFRLNSDGALTSDYPERIIQGYGYVGVHGELTGGMLPDEYFGDIGGTGVIGFNDIVQPLSVLNVSRSNLADLDKENMITQPAQINGFDERVVGDAEHQWYIKRKLHGVVSHLKLNNVGVYVKEVLPITNNYSSVYKSPSFASSVLGDCMIQPQVLANAINFPSGLDVAWQMLLGLAGYPIIFSFAPRHSILCYLQQTFGQYAYVHYNSSKSPPEKDSLDDGKDSGIGGSAGRRIDPVLSSEFTFDRQRVSQTCSAKLDYLTSGIVGLLVSALGGAVQVLDKNITINEEQGQVSAFDKGKKFVENVLDNTAGLMSSAIITQSKSDAAVTSTVTGVKSLDMFYSTSDMQRIFAGPGFVEHQFVADCVAQSVTDTQLEGKVTQFYLCIAAPTIFQMRMATFVMENTVDMMLGNASVTDKYQVCANNYGAAIASVMVVIAYGLKLVYRLQQIAAEEVTRLLDTLVSKGMTASLDGQVSRHAMSVEGKHKYGEKNEVFMWPCWGIQHNQLKYTDESVNCGIKNTPWALSLRSVKYFTSLRLANKALSYEVPNMSSNFANMTYFNSIGSKYSQAMSGKADDVAGDNYRAARHEGNVPFYQAAPFGEVIERTLPDDMAKIEGVSRILSPEPFKNENIGVSEPAFAPSLIHDYIIDKKWGLGQCATYGIPQWIYVKDTKITNCPPSNIVISDTFCGVACPYTAIEVKRVVRKAFMRPWAVTPNALAFNTTGYNCVLDNRLYHAFDGQSCRIVDLVGTPGLNKNRQTFLYAFQRNDRFKRSNIIPANEMQGNFESEPILAIDCIDPLWVELTVASKEKGLSAGTIGEDKDAVRWAIPLFTEHVSTLPACVKTLTAATLAVVDGVTGLVTAKVTDTNSAYKAPTSVDFTIGKQVYRATEEYICSVTPADGGNVITDLIPSLGLKFIGSTPTEAYFYSQATRCYYIFNGSMLVKVDMMERFRDIQKGYWDFVNQEVVMPCLMTFKRLNPEVSDKDTETDNVIVPVLSNGHVSGELPAPLTTVFNDRSWYKCVSLPSGFVYQGPNRVIINRAIFVEYMLDSMKDNLGRWGKVNKEKYGASRSYPEKYSQVDNVVSGIKGWTYNPFLLVTSALGIDENVDCLFEWTITFCWPIEMDLLYGQDNCAVVNVCADTMTPGGQLESRPTHIYLTKELFTRSGSYGYYSFRFQSKNGAGNRERLKIWSDQYIAVSSLQCEYKVVTQRRTEQLTQQVDVRGLKEL